MASTADFKNGLCLEMNNDIWSIVEFQHVRNLGYLAFALSIIFLLVGIVNYFKVKKRLQKGHYQKM